MNPRDPFEPNGFQDRRIQPLCHSSAGKNSIKLGLYTNCRVLLLHIPVAHLPILCDTDVVKASGLEAMCNADKSTKPTVRGIFVTG